VTSVLERLTHPIRELRQWGEHVARDISARSSECDVEVESEHAECVRTVIGQYAAAERIVPQPYRQLTPSEACSGKCPAYEYLRHAGELRLFNVMAPDLISHASLTEALALTIDEGGVPYGDFLDVTPHDVPPFEYGVVNLSSPILREAQGLSCRLFLSIAYSAAEGSFGDGVQTRRFIVDVTL
jgi:hypothetical protein